MTTPAATGLPPRPTIPLKEAVLQKNWKEVEAHLHWSKQKTGEGVPTSDQPLQEHDAWIGFCDLCQKRCVYRVHDPKVRGYRCMMCGSINRQRGVLWVLNRHFPRWRNLRVHESSPDGLLSEKLKKEITSYIGTQYFPGIPGGTTHRGWQCENLEKTTFADESFDMVVTQQVFEHVFDVESAFADIARTLRPGGAHVFDIPWYPDRPTLLRAQIKDGQVEYLHKAMYHGGPVNENGSLVVRDWGHDICDVIYRSSGMTTTVFTVFDMFRGINTEVFASFKPGESPVRGN